MSDKKYTSLMSAVSDIMMKNQNLYQQDLEARYAQYSQPAEVPQNHVDVPDPLAEPESINPEEVIPGSSGVE